MNEKTLKAVITLRDNITKPTEKIRNSLGGLKKNINANSKELSNYKKALKIAETGLLNIEGEMIKTSKDIKSLEKAISKGKDTTGELANKLKEAKSKLSDLKNEASSSKDSIKQLNEEIENTEKSLESLRSRQGKISQGFGNMSTKLSEMSDKLSNVAGKFAVGGGAITGALTGITVSAVNNVAEIDRVSKMVGMNVIDYQKWDKVLKSTGYSMEQANGDFLAMSERMAVTQQELTGLLTSESDLTQIVKELGLSVTDNNGNMKDSSTFMKELITATSKLKNETHKQAVMTALLSTTGEEMMPHLDEIAGGFKSVAEEDLITQEQIDRVIKLKTEAMRLWNKIQPLAVSIAEALVPVLEQVADKIAPVIEKITKWISENPKAVQSLLFLGVALTVIGGLLGALATVLNVVAMGMIVLKLATLPTTVTILGIIAGVMALVAIMYLLWKNWDKIWDWIGDKTQKICDGILKIWEKITGVFSKPVTVNISSKSNELVEDNKGSRSAFGTKRVARNDTPYRLHQGERVLTANESRMLDNNSLGTISGVNINIENMTVKEEADINKIAKELVARLNRSRLAFGGAY